MADFINTLTDWTLHTKGSEIFVKDIWVINFNVLSLYASAKVLFLACHHGCQRRVLSSCRQSSATSNMKPRPFSHVSSVWHKTASDCEAPVSKLLGMWSTHSLPGPLYFRVVVPVRVPSRNQIELFKLSVALDKSLYT